MKNSIIFRFVALLLLTFNFLLLTVQAQTPNQFKYQAVLRDASGNILADQAVTVDIAILKSSATGTSVFDETHNLTTTAQGLINLNIGSVNDISSIDWSVDTYFIEISVDGTELGTSQLLSVPYALYAKNAGNLDNFNFSDTSATNEIQDLSLSSNILSLTGDATSVDLSGYLDNTDNQNLSEVLTQNNSAGNNNITNLAGPINAQDATTKAYVDALLSQIEELQVLNEKLIDIDGNLYDVVKIGNQVWMADNLRTTHYADNSALTDGTSAGSIYGNESTKYYFDYNDDPVNTLTYGKLYTWAAVMNDSASSISNPSGVQGVCPTGWHVPSVDELTELAEYLGGTSIAGGKTKETDTTHWNSPNTGATNESGFKALPSGARSPAGSFSSLGDYTFFWSTTEDDGANAWYRFLSKSNTELYPIYTQKLNGFSVRCVKD